MPPLDSTAMIYNMPKPTTAPTRESHQGVNGDRTRPIASKGKRILIPYQELAYRPNLTQR